MSYLPTARLYMALGQAPFTLSPTWTPIDAPVFGWSTTRGRSSELGLVEGGTLDVTIHDTEGILRSLYPTIKTGCLLYLDVEHEGNHYPQFTGFLRGRPRSYRGAGTMVLVQLRATDGFLRFQKRKVDAEFDDELSGFRLVRLADDRGWPGAGERIAAAWRDIDVGSSVMRGVELVQRSAREHMAQIERDEKGLLYIAKTGALTWRARNSLVKGVYANAQATLVGAGGMGPPGIGFEDISSDENDEAVFNEVTVGRLGGVDQTLTDTDSADAYGESSFPDVRNNLLTTDLECLDYAGAMLERYKDPREVFTPVRVRPDATSQPDDVWAKVLGFEIGHRVRVYKLDPDGYVYDTPMNLQKIRKVVSYNTSRSWTETYDLALADPFAGPLASGGTLWTLPFSVLGTSTRSRF